MSSFVIHFLGKAIEFISKKKLSIMLPCK